MQHPSYHLTFDVDWAPDWAVRDVLDILREHGAPATFFATHPSETLQEMIDEGHELGIHPNFLMGSSHGAAPAEVMETVLALAPAARVMRTHSLVQASTLFVEILAAFPQITYDLSLLTYGSPFTSWTAWHARGRTLQRFNYNWEDDFAFHDPHQSWTEYHPKAPVDVFDFHPIHVVLNSHREEPYSNLKTSLGPGHLHEADRASTLARREAGEGTADLLRAVLTSDARALAFDELL